MGQLWEAGQTPGWDALAAWVAGMGHRPGDGTGVWEWAEQLAGMLDELPTYPNSTRRSTQEDRLETAIRLWHQATFPNGRLAGEERTHGMEPSRR